MADYLKAYLSSMPIGQREAILRIIELEKSAGNIATREQFDIELEKLVKSLAGDGFDPQLELEHPDLVNATRILSSMLNNNFKHLYVALGGMFHQMAKADQTVKRHRYVRKSDWDRGKAAVNKIAEDLIVHRFLKILGNEWNETKVNNFWNRKNANTSGQSAEIDERTKRLRLRVGQARRMHQFAGSTPTKISVESIGMGQDELVSKNYKPENALDNKFDTFWAHMVLTDQPIHTNVDDVKVPGAAVQVTIDLPAVEAMTYLQLMPFGSHPVQLSSLQQWDGAEWVDVSATYPAATLDWISLAFQEIRTNAIRFVLRQENYTKNTYLIPRRMYSNALVWEQVLDKELLLGVEEEDLTGSQAAAVHVNPRFRALVSGLKRFEERLGQSGLNLGDDPEQELMETVDAATRVMGGIRESDADVVLKVINGETSAETLDQDDMVEITKVEYLMGIRQMSIENRDFLPRGIYDSPKYDHNGVVYVVGLDVEESHVQISGQNQSSIEYEIEVSPNRRVAVLPASTSRVYQELLLVDPNTLKGRIRFDPTGLVEVYKNGEFTTDWVRSGREFTIFTGFNKNSIYTVNYEPVAGQDEVDIDALYNSEALDRPETFNQTDDSGMLKLSYHPYVAWEVINDPENWVQTDLNHARYLYRVDAGSTTIDNITYSATADRVYEPIRVLVDGILARNRTNYRTGEHSAFVEAPGQALIYQYIHVGRKLYFNRPITGATIEVRYRWLTQYIRLVATLRAHKPAFNPYTPELLNYRLKMKTSRL